MIKPATHFSPEPLYAQIKGLLRERILEGKYGEHQRMPSEAELMKSFSVSRITIRQALGDLAKEGLIFTVHGKGTFVAKRKVAQDITRLEGFAEAMSERGYQTFNKVLGIRYMPADPEVASKLMVEDGTEVCEIRRLRYLNREPVSLDVTYIGREIGVKLEKADLTTRDVFAIFENDLGMPLSGAELEIEAITADSNLAHALGIDRGDPVLRVDRLTYSDSKPIDYEHLFYRANMFRYKIAIDRKG